LSRYTMTFLTPTAWESLCDMSGMSASQTGLARLRYGLFESKEARMTLGYCGLFSLFGYCLISGMPILRTWQNPASFMVSQVKW
jgi:hypothetical protein